MQSFYSVNLVSVYFAIFKGRDEGRVGLGRSRDFQHRSCLQCGVRVQMTNASVPTLLRPTTQVSNWTIAFHYGSRQNIATKIKTKRYSPGRSKVIAYSSLRSSSSPPSKSSSVWKSSLARSSSLSASLGLPGPKLVSFSVKRTLRAKRTNVVSAADNGKEKRIMKKGRNYLKKINKKMSDISFRSEIR